MPRKIKKDDALREGRALFLRLQEIINKLNLYANPGQEVSLRTIKSEPNRLNDGDIITKIKNHNNCIQLYGENSTLSTQQFDNISTSLEGAQITYINNYITTCAEYLVSFGYDKEQAKNLAAVFFENAKNDASVYTDEQERIQKFTEFLTEMLSAPAKYQYLVNKMNQDENRSVVMFDATRVFTSLQSVFESLKIRLALEQKISLEKIYANINPITKRLELNLIYFFQIINDIENSDKNNDLYRNHYENSSQTDPYLTVYMEIESAKTMYPLYIGSCRTYLMNNFNYNAETATNLAAVFFETAKNATKDPNESENTFDIEYKNNSLIEMLKNPTKYEYLLPNFKQNEIPKKSTSQNPVFFNISVKELRDEQKRQLLQKIENLDNVNCAFDVTTKVPFKSFSRAFFSSLFSTIEWSFQDYLKDMVNREYEKANEIYNAIIGNQEDELEKALAKHRCFLSVGKTAGTVIYEALKPKKPDNQFFSIE